MPDVSRGVPKAAAEALMRVADGRKRRRGARSETGR